MTFVGTASRLLTMIKNHLEEFIIPVKKWLEQTVIGLNLCPFAKQPFSNAGIHFATSQAQSEEQLLLDLQKELLTLNNNDIETTLLIHPNVLTNFYDYNDFLDVANDLLIDMELDGIFQIASFHPDYQFADTQSADVENFTNRSPYPLLHIIREKSLEQAITAYPDSNAIPERNIKLMKKMGSDKLQALFFSYFENEDLL